MITPLRVVLDSNMESLKELKSIVIKQFNDYVTDEKVPLGMRWSYFLGHCNEVLEPSRWVGDAPKTVKDFIQNSRDPYRYSVSYFSDMFEENREPIEGFTEKDTEWKAYVDDWVSHNKELIEEILSSGISGITWTGKL